MKKNKVKIEEEEADVIEEKEVGCLKMPFKGKIIAVITADAYQYILNVCTGGECEFVKGKQPNGHRTYHGTMSGAVDELYQQCLRKSLKDCKHFEDFLPKMIEIENAFMDTTLGKAIKHYHNSVDKYYEKTTN